MTVVPFARRDGGATFTCTGCGYVIMAAVTDGFPVCQREVLAALRPHASRREITVNELARRIVEAAIEGKLIDAVLDDAVDEGGHG